MVTMTAIVCMAAAAFFGSAAYAGDLDLDRLAGLYTQGFINGRIDGSKYWSDDALEVAKLSPSTAYIRVHLEFFNGHQCSMWGVAEVEGPSLTYRQPGTQCELGLTIGGGKITFNDKGGQCRAVSCGMRGMYTGQSFKLSTRRPISYMPKLLASFQYLDAVEEYRVRRGK
jgi:hypothetical protein